MTLMTLKEYVKEAIKEHPKLKPDILELWSLCNSEIEEGGSESNEVSLCYSDIQILITNKD